MATGIRFISLVSVLLLSVCQVLFGQSTSYYSSRSLVRQQVYRQRNSYFSDDVVIKLIKDAVEIVQSEDKALQERLTRGIDKKLEQHTEVEPVLFVEISLAGPEICRQSRIINWIARLARERHIGRPLSQILAHPEAKRLDVTCPFKVPKCNKFTRFRSIDGTCNNPRKPYLGAGFTPFRRETRPEFTSGPTYVAGATYRRDDLPRTTGVRGQPLPNPRDISVRLHQSSSNKNPESDCSFIFTLWGQFLAHDLADRAPGKGYQEVPIECCDQSLKTPPGFCFNIDVPKGDYFRRFGRKCLSFTRSSEATDFDCTDGSREVLNQASSFIDGGSVYGNTLEKLSRLRTFSGGLLESSQPNNLPVSSHPNAKAAAQGFALFLAGDDRVNEFTGLIGIETVWMREHNRIATILGEFNPRWSDEKIFLETRRIIISMIQHITYKEYLPKLLPKRILRKYDLDLESYGYYHGYDRTVDPTVTTLFSTAAYRFGHSMMRTDFNLLKEDYTQGRSPALSLRNLFFKSFVYLQTEPSLFRGMTADASEACDRIVTSDFINHLYQSKNGNGFDLPAFNIQRGRDHGLPGYNHWRKHYGLSEAREFSPSIRKGFADHDLKTVQKFRSLYDHPDDVDVWSAGIAELPGHGEVVGPLFANVIGSQFKSLRQGDRFWYENKFTGGLSLDQISEIRKVKFARVLCDHIDFYQIQPSAFTLPTMPGNSRVSCSSLPKMNLIKWREY